MVHTTYAKFNENALTNFTCNTREQTDREEFPIILLSFTHSVQIIHKITHIKYSTN